MWSYCSVTCSTDRECRRIKLAFRDTAAGPLCCRHRPQMVTLKVLNSVVLLGKSCLYVKEADMEEKLFERPPTAPPSRAGSKSKCKLTAPPVSPDTGGSLTGSTVPIKRLLIFHYSVLGDEGVGWGVWTVPLRGRESGALLFTPDSAPAETREKSPEPFRPVSHAVWTADSLSDDKHKATRPRPLSQLMLIARGQSKVIFHSAFILARVPWFIHPLALHALGSSSDIVSACCSACLLSPKPQQASTLMIISLIAPGFCCPSLRLSTCSMSSRVLFSPALLINSGLLAHLSHILAVQSSLTQHHQPIGPSPQHTRPISYLFLSAPIAPPLHSPASHTIGSAARSEVGVMKLPSRPQPRQPHTAPSISHTAYRPGLLSLILQAEGMEEDPNLQPPLGESIRLLPTPDEAEKDVTQDGSELKHRTPKKDLLEIDRFTICGNRID
ncbi:hypothetical protein JZ751_006086 [Albula glossodonta]|uniref:Uncharacterized protein n=1 Tax=Albula glossodonta TaxID=121402 RepID=A0A8T2P4E3_9TELE|nr:hypothetical protein JZ751_006086 [Albula glossodonta]